MKLEKILWLALVASLVLALGSVVACGDDDDDDDDDDAADDDSADDDSADDDSGDDDSDLVGDCEAAFEACGVDDMGICDSMGGYDGAGECYYTAASNYFECLAAVDCNDADGSCATDYTSAVNDCAGA